MAKDEPQVGETNGNGREEGKEHTGPQIIKVTYTCPNCDKTIDVEYPRAGGSNDEWSESSHTIVMFCSECNAERADIMADQIITSQLGERYVGARLSDIKSSDAIVEFLDKHYNEKASFHISGAEGTGKTHLGAAILRYYLHKIRMKNASSKAFWSKASDYYPLLRASDAWERLINVPILIIDEVVTNNEAVGQKIYDIINERYSRRKLTITISNYSIDDLNSGNTPYGSTVGRLIASKMTRDSNVSEIAL
jgi:DNA replication protein DnaC